MERFWNLPGPSRFCEAIARDLRDGRSVAAWLPRFAPPGLSEALRCHALEFGAAWRSIDARVVGSARPIDWLFDHLHLELDHGALRTPTTLALHSGLEGTILTVEHIESAGWAGWNQLSLEYADASRGRTLLQRSPMVLVAEADGVQLPRADLLRSVRVLRGAVGRLDLQILASEHPAIERRRGAEGALTAALVVELAGWDLELFHSLAVEPLARLLEPREVLETLALKRGWGSENLSEGPSAATWAAGLSNDLDGRHVWHSAALYRAPESLARRLWSAEVRELFPRIEEARRDMIERLRGVLSLPHQPPSGPPITDASNLELGHLEHMLRAQARCNRRDLDRAAKLRRLRNRLAHLEALEPEDLSTDELSMLA